MIRQDSSAGSMFRMVIRSSNKELMHLYIQSPQCQIMKFSQINPPKKIHVVMKYHILVLEICTKPILSKHSNISFSNCTIFNPHNKCLLLQTTDFPLSCRRKIRKGRKNPGGIVSVLTYYLFQVKNQKFKVYRKDIESGKESFTD